MIYSIKREEELCHLLALLLIPFIIITITLGSFLVVLVSGGKQKLNTDEIMINS